MFELFASSLDQSSHLFQIVIPRKKPALFIAFAFIPIAFLTLGNEYKGDNITRLTLDASLIEFDTFDSLVIKKFKILVRSIHLRADDYMRLNEIWD